MYDDSSQNGTVSGVAKLSPTCTGVSGVLSRSVSRSEGAIPLA
jgi:hypothetical protein